MSADEYYLPANKDITISYLMRQPIRNLLRLITLFFTVLLHGKSVCAAEDEFQQWSTLNLNYAIDELHAFNLLTQGRFSTDGSRSDIYVLRPSLHRHLAENVVTGIGYDYLYFDPGNDEQRFWQEVAWSHAVSNFKVGHRLRIEERFVEKIDVIYRSRYRLKVVYPFSASKWSVIGSNEIFFNLNSHGIGPASGMDQNRLFAGGGYKLSDQVNMELGYQWRLLNRRGIDNINDHTLVINVFFNIP